MKNSINSDDIFNCPKIPVNYKSAEGNVEILVPKVYLDKYEVTSREKKEFLEYIKERKEWLLTEEKLPDEDIPSVMDCFIAMFWISKANNKRIK